MASLQLTDVSVRALKPPATGQEMHWDKSLPGFGLRVSQGGSKTFVLMHGTNRKRTTIGRYPIISLSDARTVAKRILAEKTLGHHQPLSTTFDAALDQFVSKHLSQTRPKTAKETERLIRKHFQPTLGRKTLEQIRMSDITDVLDQLLEKPSLANHAHVAIGTFFRFSVRRRLITNSPIEGLQLPAKANGPRNRVLTDDELRKVWIAANDLGTFGDIVKLLILTGQRRGEIAALQHDWLSRLPGSKPVRSGDRLAGIVNSDPLCGSDGDDLGSVVRAQITLPAWLTKNNREHTFPIGKLAHAFVAGKDVKSGLLFPARGQSSTPFNGWSKSKATLDKLSGVTGWTLHDLRRTFATGLAALGTPIHVTEKILNHISGTTGGLVAVYQRHQFWDEQVAAVLAWENKLKTLIAT